MWCVYDLDKRNAMTWWECYWLDRHLLKRDPDEENVGSVVLVLVVEEEV